MNDLTLPSIPERLNRAHLAFELAAGLVALPEVLARYKLTKPQLKHLLQNDQQFRFQVSEAKREWNAPKNAKERIRIKAAMATEDGLIELYTMFRNEDLHPGVRIDAYKQLVTLADVAPKKDAAPDGGRFSITINLGDDPKDALTITTETEAAAEEPTP